MTLPAERIGRGWYRRRCELQSRKTNQQRSGHAAARRLDEVGAGDGAECHLEGHLEVVPPEDQVLDSGVYDVLPSPSNLCKWGKIETPACPLCSKVGTLEHILSSCWVRAGIDGGTTRSSNPSLRQSARGSRTADTPKLQPRPFPSSG